jgi:hypothetical protein
MALSFNKLPAKMAERQLSSFVFNTKEEEIKLLKNNFTGLQVPRGPV